MSKNELPCKLFVDLEEVWFS